MTQSTGLYALFLKDHVAEARIGAHDFERGGPQRLVINVALAIRGDAPSDDLAEAVDYDFLRDQVAKILSDGHIELQETVCVRLLDICKSRSSVVCDALILDDRSRSDTYPYIEIEEQDVSIGHEASVSKIGEEQLFYLTSRGLTEAEASTMIVGGFIEPLVKELPMEYAVEMNRLIELQMEGSVG